MIGLTFSSDIGEIKREDLIETSKAVEEYFNKKEDESQMKTSEEVENWIFENAIDFINIVKLDGKIIGHSFVLPTNFEIMDKFLSREISELELFEEVKKIGVENLNDAIYLCDVIVSEKFRNRGIATNCIMKTLEKFISRKSKKPILFYEPYSEQGERVVKKVAENLGLSLNKKN